MNLHFPIPAFLRQPLPQPLPLVVVTQPRLPDGRFMAGRHPVLNRKRASVETQLATYITKTTPKQRKRAFDAYVRRARGKVVLRKSVRALAYAAVEHALLGDERREAA